MLLIDRFWPLLGHFWLSFAPSWAAFGRSWPLLDGPGATHTHTFRRPNRHTYSHGRTIKNNQKIDAKNDRFRPPKASQDDPKIETKNDQKSMLKIDGQNDGFGPPKASQNDPKIGPKSDQKSMQKTKRKKNRHKTKITPSEVQKSLKNLRKINKNQ